MKSKFYRTKMVLRKPSPEWLLIIILSLIKITLHFLTNTNYELHRDAYLYLALGNHPDLGFMSVPPSIAFFANITRFLFGDSTFSVRLFPALLGGLSVIVIGMIVKNLGGKTWAIFIAGLTFILSPSFLRSNTLFQPVTFNQFYWLLTSYVIIKLIKSKNPKFWIHLSILWAIAFLNKYSISFIILAFLISLLLTRDRFLYLSKYFIIGIGLGFLIILPNLLWQHWHGWPVLAHMISLQKTQLVHVTVFDFLIMQILMNLPGIFVWMYGLYYFLHDHEGKKYIIIANMFFTVLIILLILRGKHYYTLGIYPVLFAAGGVAIEKYCSGSLSYIRYIILIFMMAVSIPVMPYSLPLLPMQNMVKYAEETKKYGLSGALRWEDGEIHSLPQDYADMVGWQELSEIVIKTYNELSNEEKSKCAIFTGNYGQAGAISYYGKKYGLPKIISFSDNFLFWAPDSADSEILIYVNDEVEELLYYFQQVTKVGKLTNIYAIESGVSVYLCRYPRSGFKQYYVNKVKNLKDVYR